MAKKEDFDIWFDKFKPQLEDDSPKMYKTYGDDFNYVAHTADKNHRKVWTLLDSDGKLYLSPGFHYVNRLNYFLCENDWEDGQRDYKY